MPSIDFYREYKTWQAEAETHAPKAGDPAPDFELYDIEGRNLIRLSNFRGKKAVALVFGSFT